MTAPNPGALPPADSLDRSGHTPGPWTAERGTPEAQWRIYASYIPRGGRNRRIAVVGSSRAGNPEPLASEDAANARLIAAAPDLLAAAKRALQYIENTEGELSIELESGDRLRAAISRAEGSAQ